MDPAIDAYALLDVGDGRRLEQFGNVVLDRPAPAAADVPPADPGAWSRATARYERRSGAARGRWEPAGALPDHWIIAVDGLPMELRPTPAGQVGLFPEQLGVARWAAAQAAAGMPAAAPGADPRRPPTEPALGERPCGVLNLFAYTGLVTLLLARAGAAVAHVDASRPAVSWARRNAELAGLADRPIRWLVDDAARFVAREARRGRRYAGVVLDPPSYGHGPDGAAWSLQDGLGPLLAAIRPLLDPGSAFVACTAHTTGLDPTELARMVREGLDLRGRPVEIRELGVSTRGGERLATGWAVLVGRGVEPSGHPDRGEERAPGPGVDAAEWAR